MSQSYTQLSFTVGLIPEELAHLKEHNDELWAEAYSRLMKAHDATLYQEYAAEINIEPSNKMELWFEALEAEDVLTDEPNAHFVDEGIYFTCDEYVNLDLVCIYLQLVIENYPHLGKIAFEYAVVSDGMTPGGFGGGACIVTSTGYQIISTESLLENSKRAAIEVEWHCPECNTTATWTQFACANSGAPICDSCDGDMCVKE